MRATPWGTYVRIADALRDQLADAAPGTRLPSETALAAEFELARNTVRRALAVLEHDGLIIALPGRGRVVGDAGSAAATGGLLTRCARRSRRVAGRRAIGCRRSRC